MKKQFIFLFLLLVGWSVSAQIKLPDIISPHMVLQHSTNVHLWGWAEPGQEVQVIPSWSKSSYKCQPDDNGRWDVVIATSEASYTPYTLTFRQGKGPKVEVEDVMLGEVWFCSGQSNMEMPLRGFTNCPVEGANETIALSGLYPYVRMVTIEKNGVKHPVEEARGKWQVSSPAYAPEMSAVAYHFATMLQRVLDRPVGIIACSWGGSKVEGWLPKEIVEKYPDIDLERDIRKQGNTQWWHNHSPMLMYNGLIYPLTSYTIKGFTWYQGESNVGTHTTYPDRLATMVALWRKLWGQGQLPFYMVEIAPYNYGEGDAGALFRECQQEAQRIIPNSSLVCTNDLVQPYEVNNIHPKDKKSIGYRLAYTALSRDYGVEGIRYESPTIRDIQLEGSGVIITLNHAPDGFNRLDGMVGFELADESGHFYEAVGKVYKGSSILITSEHVKKPTAVRYGYGNFKLGNVKNLRGLPLFPFSKKLR